MDLAQTATFELMRFPRLKRFLAYNITSLSVTYPLRAVVLMTKPRNRRSVLQCTQVFERLGDVFRAGLYVVKAGDNFRREVYKLNDTGDDSDNRNCFRHCEGIVRVECRFLGREGPIWQSTKSCLVYPAVFHEVGLMHSGAERGTKLDSIQPSH
jgi:hypothetical protein